MIWLCASLSILPFRDFEVHLYGAPETVFDKLNNPRGTLPNLHEATQNQAASSFLENRLDVKWSKAKQVSAICLDLDGK